MAVKAARRNHVFCYFGGICVFNYEYCEGPAQGQFFPDYAPHDAPTGVCDTGGGCTGAHCIDVQLVTFGLPVPAGLGLAHAGDPQAPVPIHNGWPARPFVSPVHGRIVEEYRVKFKIRKPGGVIGPERYAYIPLLELYPTFNPADRIRVFGRGFEVRQVDPSECEEVFAFKDSQYRAYALFTSELIAHILLDGPA